MRLIEARTDVALKQFTNEFQILGDALAGDLEYIVGYFYLDAEPDGKNKISLQLFNPPTVPFEAAATGAETFNFETSRAYFAQASLQLSRLHNALSGFSVDAGFRSTEDEVKLCSTPATSLETHVGDGAACSATVAGASQVSEEFSKETYLLGLNYQHSDNLLLYALARTGYRAGGLNAPEFGGELAPFQSFGPEETKEIELGIKSDWTIGNVVGRLNLSVFDAMIDDVQGPFSVAGTADPDGDGNPANNPASTNVFTNPGEASVRGAEMELVVRPTENLELSVIATYLDKELDKLTLTPDQLPSNLNPGAATAEVIEQTIFLGSPDYSYTIGARYRLPLDSQLGDIELSGRYHTMSEVTHVAIEAPGYELVDVRIDWMQMFGSNFNSAIFVNNVTDEEALIASASSGGGLGFLSGAFTAPRMYGVNLRYSF